MGNSRDRILNLIKLCENEGIAVSFAKNKARGNKGFFSVKNSGFRIDIAKNLSEEEQLHALVHEFAHYIHYKYDKSLKTIPIIKKFDDYYDEFSNITVAMIPQNYALNIFKGRDNVKSEIIALENEFKILIQTNNTDNSLIEREIEQQGAGYLLKYDKVKLKGLFTDKVYCIDNIGNDFPQLSLAAKKYLLLNSKKRLLNRINNKIRRQNYYYNSKSELFARFIESYILSKELCIKQSPRLYTIYSEGMENLLLLEKLKSCIDNT